MEQPPLPLSPPSVVQNSATSAQELPDLFPFCSCSGSLNSTRSSGEGGAGGVVVLLTERLGAASPAALLFEAGMCLSPVLLSKQWASAFGRDSRVKSWQPLEDPASLCWEQERGGGAGGRLAVFRRGGGGAWRDFPGLDPLLLPPPPHSVSS